MDRRETASHPPAQHFVLVPELSLTKLKHSATVAGTAPPETSQWRSLFTHSGKAFPLTAILLHPGLFCFPPIQTRPSPVL